LHYQPVSFIRSTSILKHAWHWSISNLAVEGCLEAVLSHFLAVEHRNPVVAVERYDTSDTQVTVFDFHGNACIAHIHYRNAIVPLAWKYNHSICLTAVPPTACIYDLLPGKDQMASRLRET
jgi:hypothetical protein